MARHRLGLCGENALPFGTSGRNLRRRPRPPRLRLTQNLQTWFKRKGYQLTFTKDKHPSKFLPGGIITCLVPPRLPHIMIVSDKKSASGVPWIIHNIGSGTREENQLFQFEITGHYRIK